MARQSVEERFWNQVLIDDENPNGCWVWQGYKPAPPLNYGRIRINGTKIKTAHRFSWELANGPIPDGLHVLHRCDNPPCVNPAHLYLGTHQDNMRDRGERRRSSGGSFPGEKNPAAKLTDQDVVEIRERYAAGGIFQHELAAEYGVSQAEVSFVVLGKRRT